MFSQRQMNTRVKYLAIKDVQKVSKGKARCFLSNNTRNEVFLMKQANASLTLKIDSTGKQPQSLTHLAFEDELTRNSLDGVREAKNILELATELIDFFLRQTLARCYFTLLSVLQVVPKI
jgi:hypothetical protein